MGHLQFKVDSSCDFWEFLPDICWEEVTEEIFSYFRFDVWPGVWTRALRSNKPYGLDCGDFNCKWRQHTIAYTSTQPSSIGFRDTRRWIGDIWVGRDKAKRHNGIQWNMGGPTNNFKSAVSSSRQRENQETTCIRQENGWHFNRNFNRILRCWQYCWQGRSATLGLLQKLSWFRGNRIGITPFMLVSCIHNRRHRFLVDRTFEDLGMVAHVSLSDTVSYVARRGSNPPLKVRDKGTYFIWVTQYDIWVT